MANEKSSLHMVETNWDELKKKIKEHKMKRLRWTLIIICSCAAAIILYNVVMRTRTFTEYRVVNEIERSDTSATHYKEFDNGFIKYSNDGASYVTKNNSNIWNQSYEMENPLISICDTYVAIADKQGETIYVLNNEDLQGEITVNMPISKLDVAAQGTVAVLMEEGGTSYLSLFDKKGEQLAEGAIHVENGGTPMNIAISPDGKKLGVSIVDVSEGVAKTSIIFYNFSKVGQNQIDNIVGNFSYEDTIIPEIKFVNGNTMLAFSDRGVYTFTGSDTPSEGDFLDTEGAQIQSVFFDDTYFGLVYTDSSQDTGRLIKVYNFRCGEVASIQSEVSYDTVQFLNNHEVCLYNDSECGIYTLRGLEKFRGEFNEKVRGVFHETGYRGYLIFKDGVTENARLKFFNGLTTEEE